MLASNFIIIFWSVCGTQSLLLFLLPFVAAHKSKHRGMGTLINILLRNDLPIYPHVATTTTTPMFFLCMKIFSYHNM